jgi:hypothetical protein
MTLSTAHGLAWFGAAGEAVATVDPNISDPAIHTPITPFTRRAISSLRSVRGAKGETVSPN